MTLKEFQKEIVNILLDHEIIENIYAGDTSVLINCTDESCFLVNILKSKFTYIHSNMDNNIFDKYIKTHTDEEFAKDVLSTIKAHPAFFFCFMLLKKIEELEIIDQGLFLHIMDQIAFREQEMEEFVINLLSHYNIEGH